MIHPSTEVHVRRDVPVVPFTDLLHGSVGGADHRGGPIWDDFPTETVIRHCRGGTPEDVPPAAPDAIAETLPRATWCGPIVRHFGHQIADFSMRLLPSLRADPDATLLFATHPRVKLTTIADAKPHVWDTLAWFGVPFDQVRIATQPVLVRELHVLPQQEQLRGPGPSPEHLDHLDRLVARRLGPADPGGTLYVSRAGQVARFAGETYLEEHLRQHGVRILRPETVPVRAQLEAYRSAELLLFAEGSAVHGLQLLGRGLPDVVVLDRRPGVRLASHALAPRVRSLTYVDALAGAIEGATVSGRPAAGTGVALLDVSTLLDRLVPLGVADPAAWDHRRFAVAQEADIRSWLAHARPVEGWSDPARHDIAASLARAGLGHLAGDLAA